MDAAYLRAAHPEPFTILGKRLKPFCLGHEILFQRFGNRFSVESNEAPRIEDCLTGVFICSQPYHNEASLEGFKIPMRARLVAKFFGPLYIANAFDLFSRYIAAHTEIPDFYSKGDSDSKEEVGTPTVQAVKVSLMSNLGLSEDEALNVPFSLAFWNHLSWAEAQGGIQIIDEAETKRQAEMLARAKALESWVEKLKETMFPDGYIPNQRMTSGA